MKIEHRNSATGRSRICTAWLMALVVLLSAACSSSREKVMKGATTAVTGVSRSTAMKTKGNDAPTTTLPTTTATPPAPDNPVLEKYFGTLPTYDIDRTPPHLELRALYVSAGVNIDSIIANAKTMDINAIVLDLKEADYMTYKTTVPQAVKMGLSGPLDIVDICNKCHAADIKVIGRIVCFKDPKLAEARPDLCIRSKSGKVLTFGMEGGNAFVSPYNKEVWQYNIDIAIEAHGLGVDEIQFDYVRFPSGGSESDEDPYFGPDETTPDRYEAITRFLTVAEIELTKKRGIAVGADVFGIITTSVSDGEGIGQDWVALMRTHIDNLCPMIYPSHYACAADNGLGSYIGGVLYPTPDKEPYGVVSSCLSDGEKLMNQADPPEKYESKTPPVLRPYLQAFTASYIGTGNYITYGVEEIRKQVKACNDHGIKEWILWQPYVDYPVDKLTP